MSPVPIFKGYEQPDKRIICFCLTENFRIEALENFHIHFGQGGRYRLELSKKEFLELADALEKVEV